MKISIQESILISEFFLYDMSLATYQQQNVNLQTVYVPMKFFIHTLLSNVEHYHTVQFIYDELN